MIEGKTKKLTPIDDELIRIETKDILTAYDATKKAELNVAKQKTQQTCDIFEFLEKNSVTTSFIARDSDTTFIAKNCKMLPYEVVVRAYAYGSYLLRNKKVEKGVKLPSLEVEHFHKCAVVYGDMLLDEGIARDRYLLEDGTWATEVITDPLIDYTWSEWKDKSGDLSDKTGFNQNIFNPKLPPVKKLLNTTSEITPEEYYKINSIALRVFQLLSKAWDEFNVTLVDIKLEFGFDTKGNLLLADVIDNDSWRIWYNGDYTQQLDKQSFRDGEDDETVVGKYAQVTAYTNKFQGL
jgi:phosphoribosylaminoimidazole-succinocarboxamide synthase